MHGSVVFARWRKCAPHIRKPRNGCHGNVLRYRVSAISASVGQRLKPPSVANCLVPIVYTKQLIAILVPKLVAMEASLSTAGPPSNAWFLRPSETKTQTASRSVQSLSPLSNRKIAQYHGGIRTPSNTWFPGSTRVLNPNGISIGAAVFAGLTNVTDWQTTLLGQ